MFAATREDALARLQDFIPASGKYSRTRNHVFPFDHHNVSQLSPAIRHRLISEEEAALAPLGKYAPSTIGKFTQEIYWRRYWKSWFSLRPQVWENYLDELSEIKNTSSPGVEERIQQICAGESGLAIMDFFTRELLETGYLHNHARMWWAGWWIHIEKLPWQVGADFFYRELLDADPASNTLSWRWVAGLQTPGKTYLPRRSNLEKYLPPELLVEHQKGLALLEKPQPCLPAGHSVQPAVTRKVLPESKLDSEAPSLLIIHEDDLLPETSPAIQFKIQEVLVVADRQTWQSQGYSRNKVKWTETALRDTVERTKQNFPNAKVNETIATLANTLQQESQSSRQILSIRPEVGYLAKRFEGFAIEWLDRPEDLALRTLATAGFFDFWKKLESHDLLPQKNISQTYGKR